MKKILIHDQKWQIRGHLIEKNQLHDEIIWFLIIKRCLFLGRLKNSILIGFKCEHSWFSKEFTYSDGAWYRTTLIRKNRKLFGKLTVWSLSRLFQDTLLSLLYHEWFETSIVNQWAAACWITVLKHITKHFLNICTEIVHRSEGESIKIYEALLYPLRIRRILPLSRGHTTELIRFLNRQL